MNLKNQCVRRVHIKKTSFKLTYALLEKICNEAKLVQKKPALELIFDSDYGKYTLLCEVMEGNSQYDENKSQKTSSKKIR